jgi:hypothetical protein
MCCRNVTQRGAARSAGAGARLRARGATPFPLGKGNATRYTRSGCLVLIAERALSQGCSPAGGSADRGPRYTVPAGDGSPVSGYTALSSPTAPTQSRRCP